MGLEDRSSIDTMNPTLFALIVMAIHHWVLARKPGQFRVPLEFGPASGAQWKCNTRNIRHGVNNASTDVFCCSDTDLHSFLPEVQAKQIHNIRSMIH